LADLRRRRRLGAALACLVVFGARPCVAMPAQDAAFGFRAPIAGDVQIAATETPRLPKPRPGESEPPKTNPAEAAPTDIAPSDSPASEATPPEATPSETTAEQAPASDSDSKAAPLPRPRPELNDADMSRLLALDFYGFAPDFTLKRTLDAVAEGRYSEARAMAGEHQSPLVPKLVDWLVAGEPDSGMSAAYIIEILASHAGWPQPGNLQLRAEQAFHALGPEGEPVLTFYSQAEPRTVAGRLALAGALRRDHRKDEAERIVRELWREWPLSTSQAGAVLTRFGSMLSQDDHLFRFRRLVLSRQTSQAVAQGEVLGPGHDDLARATIAVLNRNNDAAGLLRDVAPKFLADPLYIFGRAHLLRRAGQPIEAARLLLQTKPDRELEGNGDVWWDERRDLSRVLLDRGTPDLAYRVVADAHPEGESERVEAAFHAGWYALRFLGDPDRAERHFRVLHTLATLPRTQSRASYWLGRTHEAWGRVAAAQLDYVEAARFGGTFYGQLAREKLGMTTTGLERTPKPSALDRIRFTDRELVHVVRLLAASGHAQMASPFLVTLGDTVDTPGEVTLLVSLARRVGEMRAGIRAAAVAEERGVKVAALPAPFVGVPVDLTPPKSVDRALVYAVARQESAFNHEAVSHAGARGLMQLMPATARATARNIRLPFSVQRLTTDPLYNATIGAHHLGELLGGLKQSYVLTFVGYNAGPGRALEWIRAYGDPRNGTADPVDWIERIPFDETRDYVQKVMENLQLYRSRTGHALSLNEDLVGGGPRS
jgi:soluble lytic murein transglycosylase